MPRHTRRELLAGGVLGGLAALGTGPLAADASAATGPGTLLNGLHGDGPLLQRIVSIEQLVATAYEHVLSTVSFSSAAASALRVFLSHERTHVQRLSEALTQLGETPPAAPTDISAVSRELESLHGSGSLLGVRSEQDALPYLVGVETVAEDAYHSAISMLSDQRLVVVAAQILACEAQHWSALNELFVPGDIARAVPYSVVLG
jgi:rubrerythrin